jgi:hypothetical protein
MSTTNNDNSAQRQAQASSDDGSASTTTSATTAAPINTYDKYMEMTQRVLQKSRQSLDTKAFIQDAYGPEKMAILGGSDLLQGILDGLLDQMVNETIPHDFAEHCNNGNQSPQASSCLSPKARMDQIDQVIRQVLAWEAQRDELEAQDAETAQQSLDATLLPEGVTTDDVVQYREYQHRLQSKLALQQELQRIEEKVEAMQAEQAETKKRIQEQLDRVLKVERQVEDAANACAMVTN